MKNKLINGNIVSLVLVMLASACQPYKPMPYVPAPDTIPSPVICHDGTGHNADFKPWILGGKCCCTPTEENYRQHVTNKTVEGSVTYEQYLKLYSEKGIVTDLDHRDCGNYCQKGPHVVMGGKCMSTPVQGTDMYEKITYGPHKDLLAEFEEKNKKK